MEPLQKVTSRILPNGATSWADIGILIPHEPIRRDLLRMQSVTDAKVFRPVTATKVKQFFTWYEEHFYYVVHHHHDIEEKIYFPWMKTKAKLPPEFDDDHKALLAMMDDIRNMHGKFTEELKRGEGAADALNALTDKLHEAVCALVQYMLKHLDLEENIIPKALVEHFSQAEEKAVIQRILRANGFKGNAMLLPWILDAMQYWATPEQLTQFRNGIPFPIRLLNKWSWAGKFKRRSTDVLEALLKPAKAAPKSDRVDEKAESKDAKQDQKN